MARLVPAQCPQCGGNVSLDATKEWVTCTFCGASSFIETPARRNAPNHPPAHVRVISVATTPDHTVRSVVGVVLFLAMSLGISLAARADRLQEWGHGLFEDSSEQSERRPSPPPPAPVPNYFLDATPLPRLIRAKFGERLMVANIVIYRTYGSIDVLSSPQLGAFDTFAIRDGAIGRGGPMLIPPKKDKIQQHVFDLSQFDFAMVPRLIADAKVRLAIPGGEVVDVAVRTIPPIRIVPNWTVLIRNQRHEQGTVDYDAQGRMVRVNK